MTASTLFSRPFVLLATFAMGAGVTVAVAGDRKRSAQQRMTAEDTVMVRQPQDAFSPPEAPATPPAAPAIAVPVVALTPPRPPAITLPAVAPAPPAAEATQPESGALAEEVQQLRDELARL